MADIEKFDMFKFEYVDNEFRLPIIEVLVNAPFIRLLYTDKPEIFKSDKSISKSPFPVLLGTMSPFTITLEAQYPNPSLETGF